MLVAIVAALVVAVAAALVVIAPREAATASPTPTASATRTPLTATPTASATASPTSSPAETSAIGRYVSPNMGYSIDTPSPWRKSTCLPGIVTAPGAVPASEVFIPIAAGNETTTDIGPAYPQLVVAVDTNPQGLTPRQWAAKDPTGGPQIEDVTYADRPAARKSVTGTSFFTYYVASGNRMYAVRPQVQLPPGTAFDPATMVRMIDSFRFLTDSELAAARAAATPQPAPRTPEQVADGMAAAFAAKDADALAGFMAACMTRGAPQAGGLTVSREKYVSDLRAALANGLVVTVRPRPLQPVQFGGPDNVGIGSTWKDSAGTREPLLVLHRGVNDRWEWWYIQDPGPRATAPP